MNDALQQLLDRLTALLAEKPLIGAWYTTVVRFVFPLLALMILVGAIRSLWKVKHPDEVWGYLVLRNGVRLPITHWENIIGRAPSCDVQLEYPSVSRQHAALIREDDGSWTIYDLGSKGGIKVNDLPVDEYALVEDGDTVTFAGIPAIMEPITAEEKRAQMVERRMEGKPAGMWGSLVLLTLFQILTGLQLIIAQGDKATTTIPLTFFVFTVICWAYFIVMRLFRRIGFEMETIAFFLCTLSLAVTGSTVPDELPKQLIAILMGLAIFIVLGFFLRDLTRAQKVRWFMSATAVGLLAITLLIGSSQGGAKAWLRLGPLSLQTSEIAKICYIFAGAATLDRLFNKRNLWMFIGLTAICGGCLALQNDFGTALVFFVTFLVIAYLRSGDFATIGLVCAGCFGAGALTSFADKLSGYNLLTGVYSPLGTGNSLYLTIDAYLNNVAYQALNGMNGTVGVYNYKTGEILCMVSTPTFDPANPPDIAADDPAWDGVYVNRLLSANSIPGSIFKVVTINAAIENIPDLFQRKWTCTGSVNIGGEEVTCPHAHGEQDIEEALANSCNGVFGQLAVELGGETMQKYADAAGLTKSIKVDGIQSSVGKFDFSGNDNQLAWSGVGQGQDTLCPINMLQYMGAIANGGKAAVPRLIEKSTTDYGLPTGIYYPHKSAQLIDEKTAGTIADMMHNNVIETYGQDRFPGMDICAKSGTAEVGADKSPNAWFTGFLRDEATPYAFIVLVENGGGGSSVAGTVASQVLQAAVEKAY